VSDSPPQVARQADDQRPDPVLVAQDVGKRYGDLAVLSDVSLAVRPGTVTALVGPNGSGKTTLLRILAGLLDRSAGTVDRPGGVERPVGYLPQAPEFRPRFTVRETLTFYGRLLSTGPDVDALLDRVGLAGVADRRIDALSGGMRRLVGIAQALLGDPPVVVLDEPTGDLDPQMTDRIFGLAESVAEEGAAVVLATHNLRGAATADEVVLLAGGTVRTTGAPEELLDETGTDSLEGAFVDLVGEAAGVQTGVRE
jgi:ABC-type multidrug transport system ATPase subunit